MAHTEVIRRSMTRKEWIILRAGWLGRHVINQSCDLDGWKIKEARQIAPQEYDFYDKKFRPLKVGDTFFTPDGTSFLRLQTIIPKSFQGERVYLKLTAAGEMIVKVNGSWAGGIDPNRSRVLVSKRARVNEKILIEIEAYNRSKPDDNRALDSLHLRGCRQIFHGAQLVTIDKEIEAAMYDVNILCDLIQAISVDEEVRSYVENELDLALRLVDYEETNEKAYRSSIRELREYLKNSVFNHDHLQGKGKIALVAHSHLDLAYYRRAVHTTQKNARTCLIQLKLMDDYPEFTYCHTQAATYENLEKYYPDIFRQVAEKVKEGRFELAGAMYVEPDCNLPSCESLIRQCLYGQHFFRTRFNKTVENCWLPDVFGNSWIMPQILRKAGVKYFVSNKMSTWNDTNLFPHNNFIWKGIDGSEIYACVPPTHFISWNTPEQITKHWDAYLDKSAYQESLNMFGYGDGGSGVTEQMLEYLKRLEHVPGIPQTRHIRGDQYLDDAFAKPDNLSVWDGELYLEMHRGTFTTKGILKKRNRDLEILARDTELLCSIAALQGADYPEEDLQGAWKKVLFNQFHDILPGTHIPPVTRDTLAEYDEAEEAFCNCLDNAVRNLKMGCSERKPKQTTINLLNSLGWKRSDPFFIAGEFGDKETLDGFVTQKGTHHDIPGLWLDGVELDSMACTPFEISEKTPRKARKWFAWKGETLETPHYVLTFDRTGAISSLVDKSCDRELVRKGKFINRLRIYRDNPGTYDAWDVVKEYKFREESFDTPEGLKLESWGPVRVTFSVRHRLKNSDWHQKIHFYRESRRIDFENKVEWAERNRLAKSEFALDLLSRHAKCDTSAGHIVRETHENTTWQQSRFEVCQHQWSDISESNYGAAIINDGKYGISFDSEGYALSLLRGPVRPDPYSDEGLHYFSYAFLPHEGSPETAGINEAARAFNSPVRCFYSKAPIKTKWMSLDSDSLHIQAVKMPVEPKKNEKSLIIRLTELKGRRGKATLSFFKKIKAVQHCNLLEDLDPGSKIKLIGNDDGFSFTYKPFEIISFIVSF